MIEVREHRVFSEWLRQLKDVKAKARIAVRLRRIQQGNFGDSKSVGDNISELRFTFGPGYRVYYTQHGDQIIVLLCGGDKGSQTKDIERAKELAAEL